MKGMHHSTVIQTPRGSVVHYKTKNGEIRAKIEWNPEFGTQRTEQYSRAQKYVDSSVLRLSSPYVPLLTGALEKSGTLCTDIGSGEVIWNTPYARYQYYKRVMVGKPPKQVTNIPLKYRGGGLRGGFWFERMKADHKSEIIAGAAKIAGGTAK